MLTVEQVKKVGTLLPEIIAEVRYTTVKDCLTVEDVEDWMVSEELIFDTAKVFGVRLVAGEDCVEIDRGDYDGSNYFVIPISELIRIGVVTSDKEFILPEKWYCPYSNKEEFDVMNNYFKSSWHYLEPDGKSGCNSNTYYGNWQSSVMESYGTKITFEQFKQYVMKQETKTLPTVWAVKNDDSQLFKSTVVKWLNEKYNESFEGGKDGWYYGVTESGKADWFSQIDQFGEGVVELTIEQFLELTNLKKPDYKLIKRMPGIEAGAIFKWLGDVYGIEGGEDWFFTEEHIKDAEFFEVVKEPEFKVGEYVVTTATGSNSSDHPAINKIYSNKGEIFKVVELSTDEFGDVVVCEGGYVIRTKSVRKATTEEIEAYNNIVIGDYKFSFPRKGYVEINGKTYDKKFVEDLANILENASDQIKSLNVGCSGQYKLDLPLLRKILARM